MLSQQHIKAPGARGHLTVLLNAIAVGCKFVSSSVRKVNPWLRQAIGLGTPATRRAREAEELGLPLLRNAPTLRQPRAWAGLWGP